MTCTSLILSVTNFFPIRMAIQLSLLAAVFGCYMALQLLTRLYVFLRSKQTLFRPMSPSASPLNLSPQDMARQRTSYLMRVQKGTVVTTELVREGIRSLYFFTELSDMSLQRNRQLALLQFKELLLLSGYINDKAINQLLSDIYARHTSISAAKQVIREYFSTLHTVNDT